MPELGGERTVDAHDGHSVDTGEVRGTQSFVHTLSWCWKHPSLLALEVLWRWAFGVPALWLLWRAWNQIVAESGFQWSNLNAITVTRPLEAAAALAVQFGLLLPPALHIARWLVPVLALGWIVFSSLGRTLVLRRFDARLHARPLTLMLLAGVRIAALVLVFGAWFLLLQADARINIQNPLLRNQEPNLVLYFAELIVGTLVIFVAWAVVSWVFSVAPLIAMLRNAGPAQSLRAAFSLGALRGKLMEINLVMGIVKIALIVLALVFSACPLPFSSDMTPEFLFWWNVGVAIWYLLASDFFHVARQVGYLHLWREFEAQRAV